MSRDPTGRIVVQLARERVKTVPTQWGWTLPFTAVLHDVDAYAKGRASKPTLIATSLLQWGWRLVRSVDVGGVTALVGFAASGERLDDLPGPWRGSVDRAWRDGDVLWVNGGHRQAALVDGRWMY